MNNVISLAKYLFAIPFAIFGIMHFVGADQMAGMAPGGIIMVYVTGLCLILAGTSIILGKYDKLASVLLALLMILFMIPHFQNMSTNDAEIVHILKNLAMAGGALLYAQQAKDSSIIG